MPLNFREGMRRLRIVVGVLGSLAGAIGGYLLVVDALAGRRLLRGSVLVNYVVASSLPVVGFLAPWGAIRVLVWIWAGFSEEPGTRYKVKAGKVARLTKLIDEAEHLLRKHGEETWANWFAEGCSRIQDRDFGGIEHILLSFDGTGSFNDIYICPENHHVIKARDVVRVNERLRTLSSGICELARELKDEEQTAQSSRSRVHSG